MHDFVVRNATKSALCTTIGDLHGIVVCATRDAVDLLKQTGVYAITNTVNKYQHDCI